MCSAAIVAIPAPKSRLSAVSVYGGVLDRVVQHRRAQRLIIDLDDLLEPGEDRRDRYRMGDVRVFTVACLALMAPRRDIAGPPDQLHVGAWPGGHDDLAEIRYEPAPGRTRIHLRIVHGDPPGRQQSRYGHPPSPSSLTGSTNPADLAIPSRYPYRNSK